jgi:transmembrane sensor
MANEHEDRKTITEQAADWWVLFSDGHVSAGEKREFVDWAVRAPEHVEGSLRIARTHKAVRRAELRWPADSAEALIREARAETKEVVISLPPGAVHRPAVKRKSWIPIVVGLAASIVAVVCFGWYALVRPEEFQTKVGEQRSVLLADGSRITLNTGSKIQVRMRTDRRMVDLIRGEALFEISHDARRPFDVRAANVTIQVLGTQFDVDRRATRTEVTVVEGRVSMVAQGSGARPIDVLSGADRVVVDATGSSKLEHGVNLREATAWTDRQLVFNRRPLAEVAEEFNRYNSVQIEIRSAALGRRDVTGTFRSDDPASFAAVLSSIVGVHVARDGAGDYVITGDDVPSGAR